jgi:hypothetical protein
MNIEQLKQQPSFVHVKNAIDHILCIREDDPLRFQLYQYLAGCIGDEMVKMWRHLTFDDEMVLDLE